jgi:hypothetical protein
MTERVLSLASDFNQESVATLQRGCRCALAADDRQAFWALSARLAARLV